MSLWQKINSFVEDLLVWISWSDSCNMNVLSTWIMAFNIISCGWHTIFYILVSSIQSTNRIMGWGEVKSKSKINIVNILNYYVEFFFGLFYLFQRIYIYCTSLGTQRCTGYSILIDTLAVSPIFTGKLTFRFKSRPTQLKSQK